MVLFKEDQNVDVRRLENGCWVGKKFNIYIIFIQFYLYMFVFCIKVLFIFIGCFVFLGYIFFLICRIYFGKVLIKGMFT